jgi:type IV pilus assembly protein PilV
MMVQHNKQTSRRPKGRQAGATMIELLVSLLIFAFGMLGLVGLQNKTLGFAQMSLYRSQAAALSDDILDRMRADRANAKSGNWNSALTETSADISGSSVAKTDLKDWKKQVEDLLGGQGKASVSVNAGVVTVEIQWDERGTTTPFTTVSGL